MVDEQLAQTSNTLFNVAFLTYIAAAVAYFFRLAFTRVTVEGVAVGSTAGRRVGLLGTVLASVGAVVQLASLATRGLAVGRVPWANMFEYSSVLALGTVVVGLLVVQRRFGYGHLMGFVLALAVLSMTSALLLFSDPGPVVPALNSYWINIHTSAAMVASSIFIVAFAATALYLVKDTAERRLAERSGSDFAGSTVGAAYVEPATAEDAPESVSVTAGATEDAVEPAERPSALAQRDTLSPIAFPIIPAVVVGLFVVIVWRSPVATLSAASVAALLGISAWYAVPYLPPAARLDALAYRVTAFAFPIWTFAILAGAIWAQEAWGTTTTSSP